MQSKFAKAYAVASLLNSASALENYDDGIGGPAPCIESYAVVPTNAIGADPNLVHGLIS